MANNNTILAVAVVTGIVWWWFRKPKSSLPGPSPLPILGNVLDIGPVSGAIAKLEQWAFKYGPIYKYELLGKPTIVISDYDTIAHILKSRPKQYRRAEQMVDGMESFGITGLFTQEGESWKHSRQAVAPAFTPSRVSAMKECIMNHARDLRSALEEFSKKQETQIGRLVDPSKLDSILPLVQKAALRVITETSFSWNQNVPEHLYDKFNLMLERFAARILSPVRYWHYFNTQDDKIALAAVQECYALMDQIIEKERLECNKIEDKEKHLMASKTILQSLVRSEKSHKMNDAEIKGNIITTMVAGFGNKI